MIFSLLYFNFIVSKPLDVHIHLEEFNKKYNLLHIGISFKNDYKTIRYDFRKLNDNEIDNFKTYDKYFVQDFIYTNHIDNIYIPNDDIILNNFVECRDMKTKDIYWGQTNKTFEEIELFEKELHKKYILGYYDCRHYVRRLSRWATSKPTPIWRLHRLWNNKI